MTEGLYTGPREDSFQSKSDLVLKNLELGVPVYRSNYGKTEKDFDFWQEEFRRRQELRNEVDPVRDFASIEIPTDRPVAIALLGDLHLGGSQVDYERLGEDIDVISNHPLIYTFLMGDLVDGFVWHDAEDSEVLNSLEQWEYARSVLARIGPKKILGAWRGNHDHHWAKKSGMSGYDNFSEDWECPVFDGIAFVNLRIGEVDYHIMGAHELPGSSIYNNAHPAIRGHREYQNIDIVAGAHTHRKGVLTQTVKDFDGGRKTVSAITGTYKKIDSYGRRKGMGTIPKDQRGAVYLILNHDRKIIRTADSAYEVISTMSNYL